MSINGYSSNIGKSTPFQILSAIKEGFDPQSQTETILEANLAGMNKDIFWNSLVQQETMMLIIGCKDGSKVIYEKGFLNRLLETKPDLLDLTEKFTLIFSEGDRVELTKPNLRLCGDYFEALLNYETKEMRTHEIEFGQISNNGFKGILETISSEECDYANLSDDFKTAMDYLQYTPYALPYGIHGAKDWKARGVNLGPVSPLPQKLRLLLDEPCPISKDGSKFIDNHVIVWIPAEVKGKPLDIKTMERIARADAFGDNKLHIKKTPIAEMLGLEGPQSIIRDDITNDPSINHPNHEGYWLAIHKKPIVVDEWKDDPTFLVGSKFPGYEKPKILEIITGALMQYGCSGDKKEFILSDGDSLSFTRCEEQINGNDLIVGCFTPSQILIGEERLVRIVCPVMRFK